jgi:predicted permease
VISFLLGKAFRLEKPLLIAVILTTAFGNNGNYGLPLISFAFGEQALAYGTLYFVTNSVMFNTLGVLLASLGNMQPRQALLGLLRVPTMYTIPLAILVNALNLTLPISVARTIDLAAAATIPLMLVLLGLELTRVQWSHSLRAMSLAVVIRLLVVPAIGFLLALPFGLQGASRQGNLLQTGMPGAVAATIAASEYELEPELVTAIIFTGTVISPLTLTPLLVLLGS